MADNDKIPSWPDIIESKTRLDESEIRINKYIEKFKEYKFDELEKIPDNSPLYSFSWGLIISNLFQFLDEIKNYRDMMKNHIEKIEKRLKYYDPDQML